MNKCNHDYKIDFNHNKNFMFKKCVKCGYITTELINSIGRKLLRAGGLIE